MKYYLGEPMSYRDVLLSSDHTGHFLVSFANNKNAVATISLLRQFEPHAVMIDSGAYSLWNSGKAVDRDQVCAYYTALKQYRADLHFIALDVIPGTRNHKPTQLDAERACAEGLDNYYFFKQRGLNVLPVFHEGDDFKYLAIYKQETDYIAISPANDSGPKQRMVWLDQVYADLRADYKTHGLAATALPLLKRYPFYSVDSVNWKSVTMYGHSQIKGTETLWAITKGNQALSRFALQREIGHYKKIQTQMTHLWQTRGVTWTN